MPKAKAKSNGNSTTLELPAPRTISQTPLYALETTIRKQFLRVVLLDEDGSEKAVLIDSEHEKNEVKVGSANLDYVCGLILGATGGRGDGPDGAAIWVSENANHMKHLSKYGLLIVPDSRGNTLEAPVQAFLDIVNARSAVLVPSLEKYPPEIKTKDTTIGSKEEEVDILL